MNTGLTSAVYFVGVFVCIVVVITFRLLISIFLSRRRPFAILPGPPANQHSISTVELGLDEATLRKFPKLIYAQAKVLNGNSTTSCCSICLADYNDTDMLRLLPDCGHLFHLKCVDSWLRLHATCPICRNSPVAEADPPPPLASQPAT